MFRLWYKSFIIIFLWIILLANLYLAFNYSFTLGNINSSSAYGENYYFGVSSLIEIFKGERFSDLTPAINDYLEFYDYFRKTAYDMLFNNEWPTFSEIKNGWDFVVEIFSALFNILKVIGSIFMYIALPFLFIVYMTLELFNLVYIVFLMLSGAYARPLPNTYNWSLICQYLPL